MGTDDAEFFSLFGTHLSVHSGKYLRIGSLHALGTIEDARNMTMHELCSLLNAQAGSTGNDSGNGNGNGNGSGNGPGHDR